jgi:uncharacterized glyoxalase superfamily protein PhnB
MAQQASKVLIPIIAVDSVDRVRSFYVDELGFAHQMGVVGKDGQFDFCTVIMDGARIMFTRAPAAGGSAPASGGKQPVEIYLEVADVQAYHGTLKEKHVTITEGLTLQWWGDRTFKVRDPAGYEIWFYQTVSEPKPPAGSKIV